MQSVEPWDDREGQHQMRRRTGWGIALVLMGVVFLADEWGWIDLAALTRGWLMEPYGLHFWSRAWPLFIVLAGVIRMFSATRATHVVKGALEAAIGFWIFACLQQLWGLTFSNSWPLLLIAFGLRLVFGRPQHPRHCNVHVSKGGTS